jgi:hypothetical protein
LNSSAEDSPVEVAPLVEQVVQVNPLVSAMEVADTDVKNASP